MSAEVRDMIYVGEKPWHGIGTRYDTPPIEATEIISGAGLDWETKSAPMFTDIHSEVDHYHAIYRGDNQDILGVVNKKDIKIVQNSDTFNSIESLLGKEIETETAACLGLGEKVFGCFKYNDDFKVVDDNIDHYLVVYNDHLRPDGKITVINTPIRVVCQNTLSAALSNTLMKYRVSCNIGAVETKAIAGLIKESVYSSQKSLNKFAENRLKEKITKEHVEKILDELFPYIKAEDGSSHDRANETTAMVRETFLTKCLDADDLQNYKGTQFQVFNALADFCDHYYMSTESGIDLEGRMKTLPGIGIDWRMSKYLKMLPKLVA